MTDQSLISQGEFFEDYISSTLSKSESLGEFTGQRLFLKNSEKYKAIIYLSAEGLGAIRIGKILGVSPNTVLAVREREGSGIDIQKQQIAQRCRSAARLCLEAIIDQLTAESVSGISAKDLGILLGILADKAELLSGGPTQRIEINHGFTHDDIQSYLMGLRRRAKEQIAEAEIVEDVERGARQVGDGAMVACDGAGLVDPGAGMEGDGNGQEGGESILQIVAAGAEEEGEFEQNHKALQDKA